MTAPAFDNNTLEVSVITEENARVWPELPHRPGGIWVPYARSGSRTNLTHRVICRTYTSLESLNIATRGIIGESLKLPEIRPPVEDTGHGDGTLRCVYEDIWGVVWVVEGRFESGYSEVPDPRYPVHPPYYT